MSPLTELITGAKSYGWGSLQVATSFESIATINASGANVFSFTGIPQTYEHLQLRGFASLTAFPDQMIIGFNNSNAGWSHWLFGNGSTVTNSNYTGSGKDMRVYFDSYITDNTTTYTAFIIDILDYKSTAKNKTIRMFGGHSINATGNVTMSSASQNTTAAITTLNVTFGNNARSASRLYLYGIKG